MTATYDFIISTGVISADTADLLSDVESEWIAALGVGLDTDASTPQGTLIQTETLARTSVMKNNAEMGSLINPTYSYGIFLDAICALMAITRDHNIQTVVNDMLMLSTVNIVVPAGTQIETSNNDVFYLLADAIVNVGAQSRSKWASLKYGNVPLPVNATFNVVSGYNVIGLASVQSDGQTSVIEGTTQLSDGALKARRLQQLSKQGRGTLGAIYGNLLDVNGVTSVFAIENATGAVGTVKEIAFNTPNGVWVCVAGIFDKQAVADSLWLTHMGGQPYDFGGAGQGNQVDGPLGTTIIDPASKLEYNVKFTTPIMYDLYVNITVKQNKAIADVNDIQQAILNYGYGNLNGELGYVIGAPQSAFEIAGAVAATYPGLYIKDCSIATVLEGTSPPVYPATFVKEWIPKPWQQPQTLRGMIVVQFV